MVGALAECDFIPVFAVLPAMLLLFPSGGLPSRRWRPAAAAGLLVTCLTLAGFTVSSRLVALTAPGGGSLMFRNPLAVRFLGPVLSASPIGTLNGLSPLVVVLLGGALVSLVVRYRAGGRLLRQQMKWLALVIGGGAGLPRPSAELAIAVGQHGQAAAGRALRRRADPRLPRHPGRDGDRDPAGYRLFDIDVIISRALLSHGLLSAGGHRRVRGHRARHRHVRWATGATRCSRSPPQSAIALVFQPLRHRGQPAGQPAGVRRAGHAVPGAV